MLGLSMSASRGLSGPLYRVDQVPVHFHEKFIIRGYRHPKSSVIQCLLSLFDATNETLNVWTHFISSCYFIWVLYQLSYSFNFIRDPYTWPLMCFVLSCCVTPMVSATAHLFNVMSLKARKMCFIVDYSAVSFFGYGSALVYRAYAFDKRLLSDDGPHSWYKDNFLRFAFLFACFSLFISAKSRFMKPSPFRTFVRIGPYVLFYLYDAVPIFHRILYCEGDECLLPSLYYHKRQFILTFLSMFLYAACIPERLLPGSFDIVGHSHQLFHITSILASNDALQAILLDLKDRRAFVQPRWDFESFSNSIGSTIFVIFGISLLLAYYFLRIFYQRHHSKAN